MKKPQIDFFKLAYSKYIGYRAWKNKFLRLWGTTRIDDTEVLVAHKDYYKGGDFAANKKLFEFLKMYKDLEKSRKEWEGDFKVMLENFIDTHTNLLEKLKK